MRSLCVACAKIWLNLSSVLDMLGVTEYGVHDTELCKAWSIERTTCCTCGKSYGR